MLERLKSEVKDYFKPVVDAAKDFSKDAKKAASVEKPKLNLTLWQKIIVAIVIFGIVGVIWNSFSDGVPKEIKKQIIENLAQQQLQVASLKITDKSPLPHTEENRFRWDVKFEAKLRDGRTAHGFAYYWNYNSETGTTYGLDGDVVVENFTQ